MLLIPDLPNFIRPDVPLLFYLFVFIAFLSCLGECA